MADLLREGVILLSGAGVIFCGLMAWRIWRGDPREWERNRHRTQTIRKAMRGEVETTFDGRRDYRVSAGIAVDTATNEWVEQGKLSAEAISAALRPPAA